MNPPFRSRALTAPPPFSARDILSLLQDDNDIEPTGTQAGKYSAGNTPGRKHLARKNLGQHFLLDPQITARIAGLAPDFAGRPVLEIGPGPGGLTASLLALGADPLIVIERDPRFAAALAAQNHPRLKVEQGDALLIDERQLLRQYAPQSLIATHSVPIIANLPYNIATPLLIKWLKADAWRGDMVLMFQKEVADRIVSKTGDDAYGRLAVIAQACAEPQIAMRLAAGAFTPPPKIASSVVHFRPRPDRPDPIALQGLEAITHAAFGQRRKMLRSALQNLARQKGLDLEAWLAEADIRPQARAEELDLPAFLRLQSASAAMRARP